MITFAIKIMKQMYLYFLVSPYKYDEFILSPKQYIQSFSINILYTLCKSKSYVIGMKS